MKILLTGHKGFIGKVLFDRLWLKGHTLTGLDLKDGDDLNTCSLAYDDIDLVIHLAGKSGLRGSVTDPGPYWTHNEAQLFTAFKIQNFIC